MGSMSFVHSILFLCLVFVSVSLSALPNSHLKEPLQADSTKYFSCVLVNGKYTITKGQNLQAPAYAYYDNAINTTGWAYLSVTSNPEYSDSIQMYASGFLEGALTTDLIWYNWINMYANQFNNQPVPKELINWVNLNTQYMRTQIQNSNTSTYWNQVSLVWTQLNAMVDAYSQFAPSRSASLGLTEFLIMNMDGDLIDILPALNLSSSMKAVSEFNVVNMYNWIQRYGHCSGLIKVTPDYSDLFVGHTTWSSYYEMVRMLKSYNFPLSGNGGASSIKTLFSGYPATLSSVDDYYVIDTGLVVFETTNGIMNNTLYSLITPQSVLSWVRAIVANRMATGGKAWVETFSKENSGTYNNQWSVVDFNKFYPGKYFTNGAFYILEQIPGYVEYADVTAHLETGYFPSFNVPYFEYVFNVSGFWYAFDTYGSLFSYQNNPRAQIFRRDANSVKTISDFQNIMRFNNWMNDPLSHNNAGNAISSRFDLVNQPNPDPFLVQAAFGGIDSKVTSYLTSIDSPILFAQSGPTHDAQPPFNWDVPLWENVVHEGMPSLWNFDWVKFATNPDYVN